MPRLKIEPFHEPIGLSPEGYSISRRWVVAVAVLVAVLAAALLVALGVG